MSYGRLEHISRPVGLAIIFYIFLVNATYMPHWDQSIAHHKNILTQILFRQYQKIDHVVRTPKNHFFTLIYAIRHIPVKVSFVHINAIKTSERYRFPLSKESKKPKIAPLLLILSLSQVVKINMLYGHRKHVVQTAEKLQHKWLFAAQTQVFHYVDNQM